MDNLQVTIPGLKDLAAKHPAVCNEEQCSIPWIGVYIVSIFNYGIGVVGILAAIVLMFGGVIWIMAGGSAEKIGEAKKWIGASLAGLIIALSSYMILYQINPDLTVFKPLRISVVKKDISDQDIVFYSGGGEKGGYIPTNASIRDQYDAELLNAAQAYSVDCTFLKAIMFAESSGNSQAKSSAGAVGLMQLMPSTAKDLGYYNLYNPQDNINAGALYIKQLQKTACNNSAYNKDCAVNEISYIIAAYNGGPGANKSSEICSEQTWWECEKNSGYAQTRDYVKKVNANYQSLIENGWGC